MCATAFSTTGNVKSNPPPGEFSFPSRKTHLKLMRFGVSRSWPTARMSHMNPWQLLRQAAISRRSNELDTDIFQELLFLFAAGCCIDLHGMKTIGSCRIKPMQAPPWHHTECEYSANAISPPPLQAFVHIGRLPSPLHRSQHGPAPARQSGASKLAVLAFYRSSHTASIEGRKTSVIFISSWNFANCSIKFPCNFMGTRFKGVQDVGCSRSTTVRKRP